MNGIACISDFAPLRHLRVTAQVVVALSLMPWMAGCGGDEPETVTITTDSGVVQDAVVDGGTLGDGATSDSSAGTGGDASSTDDAASAGKAVGEPCEKGAECNSGLCAWSRTKRRCVAPCADGKCPAGTACAPVDASDSKSAKGCIDRHLNLCRPCKEDDDCGPDSGTCLETSDGSGSFCGSGCEAAGDCPKGFTCDDKHCIPTAGECLCSAYATHAKAETLCKVINAQGACPGTRACGDNGLPACGGTTPTAELCDGTDNDCDGATDEEVTLAECSQKSGAGICYGKEVCTGGKLTCDATTPGKEVCDGKDNDCDSKTDEGFVDTDEDDKADCIDPDDDNDGVVDGPDNCTLTANKDQLDTDKNGLGDACDDDDDGDGVPDAADSCTLVVNPNQSNNDSDEFGDLCDPDDDNDGVPDAQDNCGFEANKDQLDSDKDGKGNACDNDDDGDGVIDTKDNCPLAANKDQLDTDKDKAGDACDTDDDGDKVLDTKDNCPLVVNPKQTDTDKDKSGDACDADDDGDGVLDLADNCTLTANKNQENTDKDGLGDACDDDDDGDGKPDGKDNCPLIANPGQADYDKDGKGDDCDPDDDDDGIADTKDNCPLKAGKDQTDTDKDGKGNLCDPDDDNDEIMDSTDNCPLAKNNKQTDTDGDKKGDACDDDDDGDGDPDSTDCAPLDKTVHKGAKEVCDGQDNNCDKNKDPEGATGCEKYYEDTDKDGFAVAGKSRCLCKPDGVWSVKSIAKVDCKPNNKAIFPGAKEVCDGEDNNCDGTKDEANAQGCKSYYKDEDKDGWGVGKAVCLCAQKDLLTATKGGDCYDKNKKAFPGQTTYFSVHRGDNSYDYNCDTKADKRWGATGQCKNLCFTTNEGWSGAPPSCGGTASWLDKCSVGFFKCNKATSDRKQECR
ncbi:MAG: thrombospondin type 3 repeat-containing protein [Myxococcales bacterium]|nr:thrombospondin type 3 repeat-containing protein [Myxococcales bacterium]